MSNFVCEKCGTACIDSPHGYTTGCGTYPPDVGDANQCDGCMRGLPITNGIHAERDGRPYMCCSRNRYSQIGEKDNDK